MLGIWDLRPALLLHLFSISFVPDVDFNIDTLFPKLRASVLKNKGKRICIRHYRQHTFHSMLFDACL